MRILIAFAVAFACLFAMPASAADGPPPPAGAVWMPAPRLACSFEPALAFAFDGGTGLEEVRAKIGIARSTPVNGKPLCIFASRGFLHSVTVLRSKPIGTVILDDNSEMRAWSVHGRFPNGEEMFLLWLEYMPGSEV